MEEGLRRERLPEDNPRCEDVDAAIDVAGAHLFGGHIGELALHLTFARRLES